MERAPVKSVGKEVKKMVGKTVGKLVEKRNVDTATSMSSEKK